MKLEKVSINKQERKSFLVRQSFKYNGDDYWDWSVWIDSDDQLKLDQIQSVTYHLHSTFADPVRVIRSRRTKFKLATSGWGTFTIYIVLHLKDNSVVELSHELELEYPEVLEKKKVVSKK